MNELHLPDGMRVYYEIEPVANDRWITVRGKHVLVKEATVGKSEHEHAAMVEKEIAAAVRGQWAADNEFYDARKGKHFIEVKSLLKGAKREVSMHDDALVRKMDGVAAHPGAVFHTVAVDERATYSDGANASKYSGHRMYYKRGADRYALSQMEPVRSPAHLRKLIRMSDEELPAKARGSLPTGEEAAAIRQRAERDHAYRIQKNRERRARGLIR